MKLPASDHRFNGATAFRQWKQRCRGWPTHTASTSASMEPPPFGSGNKGMLQKYWKSAIAKINLQWSHRLSAVETHLAPNAHGQPRRNLTLQWSHRLSAVETSETACALVRSGPLDLQWSHRLSAVETQQNPCARPPGCMTQPSMEPPPFGSGNSTLLSDVCAPHASPCAFNGATAFRQWKRR